jgi:hypothetical protein
LILEFIFKKIRRSHDDPSPSAVGEHLPTIIPRSVYDYAAMVHEIVENPRQNKLNHDVNAVLGSSDPPAGFGFLHPRFYYLEQKRPIRMEPLRVCIYLIPFDIMMYDR